MKTDSLFNSLLVTVPRFLAMIAMMTAVVSPKAATVTEEESTLTKVGQVAPNFVVRTLDGKEFTLESQKGKVVLVNFFATWCGPCLAELPHVEKEIWQKFKQQGLIVIAVGREHQNAELLKFQKEKKFTFLIAGDPKREAYAKYASQYIPRTYLVDKEGRIAFQSVGFQEGDLQRLLAAIEKVSGAEGK